MTAVFYQYAKEIMRNPFTLVLMLIMTIVFSITIGGANTSGQNVHVFSNELTNEEVETRLAALNESEDFNFMATSTTEAQRMLSTQEVEGLVELEEETYIIHLAFEDAPFLYLVQPVIDHYYTHSMLATIVGNEAGQYEAFAYEEQFVGVGGSFDQSLQSLFGFTLYFSFFTMGFTIMTILELKESRVWNRLILSPTSKTKLYSGHLIVSFALAYVQIAIVLALFVAIFDYDFYGGFGKLFIVIIPYLFAIMAFGVFLSGIVRASQQLNAIIPLSASAFAMLGGAFWPLQVVQSEWLLALSYASPIRYGLEMMMGATFNNWSLEEFFLPGAILLFMGLVLTGIGIQLMERKSA
ncbi:ABC transport system, permease component YbhR [Bacillus sp. JCM 19046]|nr:ABC transport system, permease component YbhR [Bacillus sp. JCM 19045]GAF17321.1 ABC transport system, permease component YbhR [Bacillus sp. JCM 19046]